MLSVDRLCKLIKLVKERFVLDENCEITVEVNPKTVNLEALTELRRAGANRLSIGVQSANDEVLRKIGRIHSFDDAKKCILDARNAGFKNISADIIFALPYQSYESFVSGVKQIMSTNVDHISAYSLQLEEGTALFKRRDELDLPDEENEEMQYDALCSMLTENGFNHYEVSSFGRDGFESHHNLNYWSSKEYFGFGAGAHSYYNNRRFSAKADLSYFISQSRISLYAPTDYEITAPLTDIEKEEERILLGLRTSKGITVAEDKHTVAKRIAEMGYGRFENGVLSLNSKGFRVSNTIISMMI